MKRKDEITEKAFKYGVKNPGKFVETPYFSQVGGLYSQSDIELAYKEGALLADKTMLKRACEWLKKNIGNYKNWEYNEYNQCVEYDGSYDIEKMINDFKKAMKE